MPNEPPRVSVEFTPEFKRNLRALSKKYRHIRSDVHPLIEQLEAGEFVGDRISGTTYVVFKVRVRNRDIRKGKSFRLLTYLSGSISSIGCPYNHLLKAGSRRHFSKADSANTG